MSSQVQAKTVTAPWVCMQKGQQKITMLTAYDYPTARLLDEAGVDLLLVGDSLGTVLYGEPNTLSVTMEDMIRHTRAVSRGTTRAMVVADMPFMSYQVSTQQALENAGRLLKEAGAQAVKLEGGLELTETVRALIKAGIPVVGHIGLTPQSIHVMGRYRMFGQSDEEKKYLLDSALALQEAGAFCLVLECVEAEWAAEMTKKLSIPSIGIGSGKNCDGQVLVIHDLLGLTAGRVPKFVEPEAALASEIKAAVARYITRTKTAAPTKPISTGGDHALSH